MLENLLNHFCDIYHPIEETATPGYNLPASPALSYPEQPDIAGQQCHFGVRSASVTIAQTEPINAMDARIKLTLPYDTDIRLNDKIINCDTQMEYTAEMPVNVRNHHIFVYIKKKGTERYL